MSISPNVSQGRVTNVQDRVAALTSKVNQPVACACGSTHFYQVRAEEYADNGYASAQIRLISNNSEPLYVCICGTPIALKDTVQGKTDSPRARFLRSLQLGLEFQKKNQPQSLAQGFVSIAEHEEAKATIEELQGKVDWLMSAVEALTETDSEDDEIDEEAGGTSTTAEPVVPTAVHSELASGKGRGKNKR